MIIKKEKSRLIFLDDERGEAQYDLADNKCYKTSRGKMIEVKSLNSYFTHTNFHTLKSCFEDENYRKFVNYVCNCNTYDLRNTGTILKKLSDYNGMEQYFAIGINCSEKLYKPLSIYPKDIIKIFRKHNISLNRGYETVVSSEKHSPLFLGMLRFGEANFESEDFKSIASLASNLDSGRYSSERFRVLVETYNYDYKRLLQYLFDYLPNREACDPMKGIELLKDYASMSDSMVTVQGIGGTIVSKGKFEKYPRYLKTTHDIVVKNYNVFRTRYDEEIFASKVDKSLEHSTKRYSIFVPKTSKDVVQEGQSQHHCVGSYVKYIMDGTSQIVFMRETVEPTKSLVTIEIKNGAINQQKGIHNRDVTKEEDDFIVDYAKLKNIKYRRVHK